MSCSETYKVSSLRKGSFKDSMTVQDLADIILIPLMYGDGSPLPLECKVGVGNSTLKVADCYRCSVKSASALMSTLFGRGIEGAGHICFFVVFKSELKGNLNSELPSLPKYDYCISNTSTGSSKPKSVGIYGPSSDLMEEIDTTEVSTLHLGIHDRVGYTLDRIIKQKGSAAFSGVELLKIGSIETGMDLELPHLKELSICPFGRVDVARDIVAKNGISKLTLVAPKVPRGDLRFVEELVTVRLHHNREDSVIEAVDLRGTTFDGLQLLKGKVLMGATVSGKRQDVNYEVTFKLPD